MTDFFNTSFDFSNSKDFGASDCEDDITFSPPILAANNLMDAKNNLLEKGKTSFDLLEQKLKEHRDTTNLAEDNPLLSDGEEEVSSPSDDDDLDSIEPISTKKEDDYFDSEMETLPSNLPSKPFSDFNLCRPLLKALSTLGLHQATPIQAAAIPIALMGKDICGGAVTGSGKTAAFLIPVIERLMHRRKGAPSATRVLIILPTRELAVQCHEVATQLASTSQGMIRVALAAGGMPLRAQEASLRTQPEIAIGTPGRLIDLLRNSQGFSLDSLEVLILDEADRMLDDGFKDELDEILRLCPSTHQRQTMLFSASMTESVDQLARLSLRKPIKLFVDGSKGLLARKLHQEFIRIRDGREGDRLPILLALCKKEAGQGAIGGDGVSDGQVGNRCIVFMPTKELAHRFRLLLGLSSSSKGEPILAAELHGGLTQAERLDSLQRFRDGKVQFLVATDVAARGLDIPNVNLVLMHSMPIIYATYLHRVGRTARAGLSGRSLSLVGEGADRKILKQVQLNSTEPIRHRLINAKAMESISKTTHKVLPALEDMLEEEREKKEMDDAERDINRAQNIIDKKDEINSRPARTWFQSGKEKRIASGTDSRSNSKRSKY